MLGWLGASLGQVGREFNVTAVKEYGLTKSTNIEDEIGSKRTYDLVVHWLLKHISFGNVACATVSICFGVLVVSFQSSTAEANKFYRVCLGPSPAWISYSCYNVSLRSAHQC